MARRLRLRLRFEHVPLRSYSSWSRLAMWGSLLAGFVLVPVAVYLGWGRSSDDVPTVLSTTTGLIGFTLLMAAFAVSRIRILTNHLGIEIVLRSHRAIAVLGTLAVLAHIEIAVAHTGIDVLTPTPGRVRAAEIATVLLLLSVGLALTRPRRRPRYEGWRLWHLLLAWGIIATAGVHILLLDRLVDRSVIQWWLLGDVAVAVALLTFRWLYRPLFAYRHSYRVINVERESASTVTISLKAHKHIGVPYAPGQFAWLKVGHSPFVFAEHPFTISSGSTDPNIKEVTIKALGDFTEVIESLRPGSKVYLDGPHGRFTLDDVKASGFVFIAGGVGITPMMSMLRTLAEREDKRPALLIAAAPTESELMFQDDLDELNSMLNLVTVEVVMDPSKGWRGEQGRINRELLARCLPTNVVARQLKAYFICGSPLMVAAVVLALEELNVPSRRIHTELFGMV